VGDSRRGCTNYFGTEADVDSEAVEGFDNWEVFDELEDYARRSVLSTTSSRQSLSLARAARTIYTTPRGGITDAPTLDGNAANQSRGRRKGGSQVGYALNP
jgi:hypothetical protein